MLRRGLYCVSQIHFKGAFNWFYCIFNQALMRLCATPLLVSLVSLVFADPGRSCRHFISFWTFSIKPFDPEFRTYKHANYLRDILLTLRSDTWSDFQHFCPREASQTPCNKKRQKKIDRNNIKERSHQSSLRCRGRAKMKGLWCIIHFFYHCHHLFH